MTDIHCPPYDQPKPPAPTDSILTLASRAGLSARESASDARLEHDIALRARRHGAVVVRFK